MLLSVSKRCFDILVATVLLLSLSPVLVAIAVAIKLTSPGPAFFRQKRVGRWGIPFFVYKFRTMRVDSQGTLITRAGDSRITPIGCWLRRWKLDELPQLLNVIVGDMSLVGPRPQVPKYVSLYSEKQKAVLSVRPGLTGHYQISFPHYESVLATQADPEHYYISVHLQEKLSLELRHVEEPSLLNDLRILCLTLIAICGSMSMSQRNVALKRGNSAQKRAA